MQGGACASLAVDAAGPKSEFIPERYQASGTPQVPRIVQEHSTNHQPPSYLFRACTMPAGL